MTVEKVLVTKEVAEAIEKAKGTFLLGPFVDFADGKFTGHSNNNQTLRREFDKDTLLHAVFYGYEIEKSPEDDVREYYVRNGQAYATTQFTSGLFEGRRQGIINTLAFLGIKIEGVNE